MIRKHSIIIRWKAFVRNWPLTSFTVLQKCGRFSNRPVGIKHFQAIHRCINVARGLVLLFGIGTKSPPHIYSRRNGCHGRSFVWPAV
jgi:hypothetical protein